MPRKDTTKIDLLIGAIILAIIYVALITIPISSEYNDIYVKAVVEKPLVGDVYFTALEAYAQPNTLLSTPNLGSILTSGTVVVRAHTPSKEERVTVQGIWRTTSSNVMMVLKKIPIDETKVTVTLYEDNSVVETQEVQLS